MTKLRRNLHHGNGITRRNAMQQIATGVGVVAGISLLPASWTAPVIELVVLPANAATSSTTLHDPCEVTIIQGDSTSVEIIVEAAGFVTPPTSNLPVKIVASAVGGTNQEVTATTTTTANGTFEAIITIDGGPGINMVNVHTSVTGADGTASCSVLLTGQHVPDDPPSEPLAVNATTNSTLNITVSWTPPSGTIQVSGYNIYRSEAELGPYTLIDSTTSLFYVDNVPKTFPDFYWYYVTAWNVVGESTPSATVSGTRM